MIGINDRLFVELTKEFICTLIPEYYIFAYNLLRFEADGYCYNDSRREVFKLQLNS